MCLILHMLQSYFVHCPIKTDPWSVKISAGLPILEKISSIASATVVASTLVRGMASGYLDSRHMHVRIYLCLLLVLGNGSTRSKATLEKGVPIIGRG